jgi:hypothetical protein
MVVISDILFKISKIFLIVDIDNFKCLILSTIVMQVILPNQIEADERCKNIIENINMVSILIIVIYMSLIPNKLID